MKGDEGDGEGREKEKKGSSIQYPKMTRASTTIKTSMLLQLSLHHHEPAVQIPSLSEPSQNEKEAELQHLERMHAK